MNGRVILAVLLTLALIAGAAGIGITAYNAGMVQGRVETGQVAAPAQAVGGYPYYGPFFHPFGFGFGFFGFLIPLFFLFIAFGVLRAIFWRGRWGGYMRHGQQGQWDNGVPPRFEEWHRRMHDKSNEPHAS